MTDRDTIHRGFEQLRELCDPRGHDLLDAIEGTLVESLDAVARLDAMFQIQSASEVVDLRDNDRWSRKVPDNVRRIGVSR